MGFMHIYQLLIDFDKLGITRYKVMSVLYEIGIGTQVHYVPVHLQPYYENRYGNRKLPGAMEFYRRTLSVPLFAGMTLKDVDRVTNGLTKTLGIKIN